MARSRIAYAGIAAELLFAGDDRREGSSIDEIVMSQLLAEHAALRVGIDAPTLWRDQVAAWCNIHLHRNCKAHAEITAALMKRRRLKGKALRELCAKVTPIGADEYFPDIQDHTSQLVDRRHNTERGGGLGMTSAFEIVCFAKTGGPLTKRISLNDDGSTKSDGSGCLMHRGTAVRTPIASIAELAALISALRPDQAIALGALRADLADQVSVVTKDKLKQLNGHAAADVIARTADSIQFRSDQPGFALFDYDTKGMPADIDAKLKERGKYWTALCEVLPGLRGASYMRRRSTSAGLLRTDTGEELPVRRACTSMLRSRIVLISSVS